MTYYEDESPYRHMLEFMDEAVNIGWFDESISYGIGDVPSRRHPASLCP